MSNARTNINLNRKKIFIRDTDMANKLLRRLSNIIIMYYV